MSPIVSCFLCSNVATTSQFPLTSFVLPASKREASYFISELLGNKYFVVCGNDAALCENCGNLLSKFDLLENELSQTKGVLLRHLEKKCQLKEGTLSEIKSSPVLDPAKNNGTFLELKRAAMETHENIVENSDPRSRIVLTCESCEYTCNYTTFVERHVNPPCTQCGLILANGVCPINCAQSTTVNSADLVTAAADLADNMAVADADELLEAAESSGRDMYYEVQELALSEVSNGGDVWDASSSDFLQNVCD